MKCQYCETYRQSTIRIKPQRFCIVSNKMVNADDVACDDFTITSSFWCFKSSFIQTIPACYHRQSNPELWPECSKCSQSKEILEVKRFVGRLQFRKNNCVEIKPTKKKIIKKKSTKKKIQPIRRSA